MSLVNFRQDSLAQLKALLGSYGNEVIGQLVKDTEPYIESRWYKVTEEVDGEEEGTKEYKAEEVYPTGDPVINGIIFDSDGTNTDKPSDPIYKANLQINTTLYSGSVEVGKAYRVEAVYPKTYEDPVVYYIIPEGGGGSTDFRLQMTAGDLTLNTPAPNGADVITDLGEVVESGVTVIQRTFDTAKIYSEVLYGYIDEEGYYCIDKSLLGV